MNKTEWKKIIEEQIKFDHDYIPSFQTTIQILSEMLEERDRVYAMYMESGAQPVVNFTSDRGAINLKPNPLLRTWQEINTLCLSYLRDLGLTAAGLRKLQGQIPKEKPPREFNLLDEIQTKYGLTMARASVKPKLNLAPEDKLTVKTSEPVTKTKTTKTATKTATRKKTTTTGKRKTAAT